MSSKVAYLQKYGSTNATDPDKKKRKKKPASNSRMKVMDDEEDANKSSLQKSREDSGRSFWDAGGKEEEAVVVEYTEDRKVSRGSWSAIEENDTNNDSPPRRSRHDSDNDTDESPPKKKGTANLNANTRHDSDDESPPRRGVAANSNANSRHDSDSDEGPPRRKLSSESSTARNRLDSSDDEPPRRQKDNTSSSRRRHDSDDESSTAPQRSAEIKRGEKTEKGLDSNSISIGTTVSSKQEAGSSSSKGDRKDERRSKTASGHNAGLQTGEGFGKTEKELKSQRDEELKGGDPSLQGAGQDTVYRDKKGKKLDMLNEFMRQQAVREGKEFKLEKAQHEWGKGLVQKQEVRKSAIFSLI
jgi:pre-mRNA-splicing factor CWC26